MRVHGTSPWPLMRVGLEFGRSEREDSTGQARGIWAHGIKAQRGEPVASRGRGIETRWQRDAVESRRGGKERRLTSAFWRGRGGMRR